MNVQVNVEAGVCGFVTKITATSEDAQFVSFKMASSCEKIRNLAKPIEALSPVDAITDVFESGDRLLGCCRKHLTACCTGCAVPVGLFKAMQVAANLALPADVKITMTEI